MRSCFQLLPNQNSNNLINKRDRARVRYREIERLRDTGRNRETEKDGEIERDTKRQGERQRDRERQRDKERERQKILSDMYWMPEMYNNFIKARFMIASPKSTLKSFIRNCNINVSFAFQINTNIVF